MDKSREATREPKWAAHVGRRPKAQARANVAAERASGRAASAAEAEPSETTPPRPPSHPLSPLLSNHAAIPPFLPHYLRPRKSQQFFDPSPPASAAEGSPQVSHALSPPLDRPASCPRRSPRASLRLRSTRSRSRF
ncbi:hypothetical protein DAI22_02g310550 [Oryza sativa Japonica Group]|nr:hypothetical protein DAI22_02g310550 [Oryza sativa Japonica Group]